MKTLLVGNFGAHNLGDELILLAALKDYPEATVITADAEWTQEFCEQSLKTVAFPPTAFRSFCRYVVNSDYRLAVTHLKNFDRIVFAGGGLFAIKLRACLLWYLVFWWLKKLNPRAEFRFEFQGVDQYLSGLSKYLTRITFAQADFISVRDENSRQALFNMGIEAIELTGDRVELTDFSWFCECPSKAYVLVNALAAIDESTSRRLKRLGRDKNLVFLAFQASDENYLPQRWPGNFEFPTTKTELFNLMANADSIIGERLHGLLLGTKFLGAQRVKLLRAPYAEKVRTFSQKYGWNIF